MSAGKGRLNLIAGGTWQQTETAQPFWIIGIYTNEKLVNSLNATGAFSANLPGMLITVMRLYLAGRSITGMINTCSVPTSGETAHLNLVQTTGLELSGAPRWAESSAGRLCDAKPAMAELR